MTRKLSTVFMILGAALVVGAALLLAYNQWEDDRASAEAMEAAQALIAELEVVKLSGGDANGAAAAFEPGEEAPEAPEPLEEYIEVKGKRYLGVLNIPAADLSLPVMATWSERNLKRAPCRYYGTVADGSLVIAAHNYKRHFSRIASLAYGDAVEFIDALDVSHHYRVEEIRTAAPADLDSISNEDCDLTLFTCTYGGRERVIVKCVRTEESQPS